MTEKLKEFIKKCSCWINQPGKYKAAVVTSTVSIAAILLLCSVVVPFILAGKDDTVAVSAAPGASGQPAQQSTSASTAAEPTAATAVPPIYNAEPISLTGTSPELYNIANKYGCAGVQMAVIEKGEIKSTYEYGWADRDAGIAMTSDTKIRVASLSKLLVGMTAMQKVEEGDFTLDTYIGDIMGYPIENPYSPTKNTLRHLLTHTSSLNAIQYTDYRDTLTEMLSQSSVIWKKTDAGKEWRYSNFGIGICGAALEKHEGVLMQSIIDERWMNPLGIDASFRSEHFAPNMISKHYYHDKDGAFTIDQLVKVKYSDTPGESYSMFAGGLHISAKDYAKLVCIMANDGEYHGRRYLAADTVSQMETVQFTPDEQPFEQCVILRHLKSGYDGRELYFHTGNAYGVLACFCYDPITKDGVVVVTTGVEELSDQYKIYNVCAEYMDYALKNLIAH